MRRVIVALLSALISQIGAPALADEVDGDFARGAKYYADNCARCHKARAAQEHRPREWSIVIQHMRIIGGLPAKQARDIEAFLRVSSIPPPTQ